MLKLSPSVLAEDVTYYPISYLLNYLFELFQKIIIYLFSPNPPRPDQQLNGPRIAVIGAGVTGVSAAAHCVSHGCDVVLFESRPRENLGGIWSRVNSTSSLQIYSVMYRFHPSVTWHKGFPSRGRILEEVEKLWHRYHLAPKTRFDTAVTSVSRANDGKWIVKGERQDFGAFDGIIASIGTCGEPSMPHLPGQEQYEGQICHSSRLDGVDVRGKNVVIVGGGASAIEAVEYAVAGQAERVDILSRSDKWILPRNIVVDALLSLNVFGYETFLSFIPEFILRHFFYRDLADLAPAHKGLFTATPMCNDQILDQIRAGKARWLRGDIEEFGRTGMQFNHREQGVPAGGPGKRMLVKGDIFVYATGFKRPDAHFLPDAVFEPPYAPPAWYLQTFPPEYAEICAINSMYVNALGTVGHAHIGIYTRILLMFLLEVQTKPSSKQMKRWIDITRWIKHRAPSAAFDFFTYSEMMLWMVECVASKPSRWKWLSFVFLGWGKAVHSKKLISGI